MWGLPQKKNARRADKIRLCGHLRRYKKIVKKTYIIYLKFSRDHTNKKIQIKKEYLSEFRKKPRLEEENRRYAGGMLKATIWTAGSYAASTMISNKIKRETYRTPSRTSFRMVFMDDTIVYMY